ncbi:hypothetical protein [Jidongwangia harbinensis]|uniref:hypothetical protein n=1 Tax=Jidongwangia harbinensis TaxID=2878561 RepID=UPI001CDA34D0|nr:hypothetical protein [Jidongwangia harbinensis]MCA2218761.1 hypothetical protein [Jidongwangia harbinensis]
MTTYRLAGAAAATAVLLSGCTAPGPAPPPPCSPAVRRDVLPEWARSGFGDPSPSGIPFVVGDQGRILGVLFGHPLTAPPRSAGPANKILWTAHPAPEPGGLVIEARLAGAPDLVRHTVSGGPGPSIVDLPRPGCWRLTLTWPGHTDTLDLRYAEPELTALRCGTPPCRAPATAPAVPGPRRPPA